METNTTPYHRINKFFLSVIGQWPHQSTKSKWICYLILFFFCSTQGYLQTAGMIAARIDIDVFLEAIPTVLADVICGIKMFNFSVNAAKMKKLLLTMEEDWKMYASGPENKILNEYAHFGRKVTIYYTGALYGTLAPLVIVPITPLILDVIAPMNESYPKHLMFQQIEFLVDAEKYFYPLFIHNYMGTVAFLTIIIAIDTMLMVYIQHGCAKFAILGLCLERIAKNDQNIDRSTAEFDDIDYREIVKCIAIHNRAIEFANLIEDANHLSFLIVIGINIIMMTTSALVAVFKLAMNDTEIAGRFAFFTLGEICHIFYSSWQGELILKHSESIFYFGYQANWNNTSTRSQKLMVPLLLRSAIPCRITAGKMFEMSLKSFSMIVKTSFSYLTVFASMRV
ncbi:odorant receptor 13a [Microplitis demolitor]|uniref:odorant receptor 13a n=1 Tax=Microplitis demolitor TaxID=69319 RepID=UPI0006D4F71F|nr:odorant receptor 13a [Microplitis demolitor]